MKISLKTFIPITVILTALLIPSATVCRAQGQPLPANLVMVTAMPSNGCFWSMQLTNFPPWPADPWPWPACPLYTDGNGNYFYDDREIDYAALASAAAAPSSCSGNIVMAQDDTNGPPSPPGGGGGGGGSGGGGPQWVAFTPPASGYVPCETWTNFWLEISASSNVIDITISNTLPGMSYHLLETTNLNNPEWTVMQTLTATGPTTAASPVSAGTNLTLFFAATLTTNDQPPLITVPPSNQVVAAGSNAVFTVTATGLAPLSYQWQFNGTNLPGKTASTLTIANVQTNNVGPYTVIVSNVICWDSATAGLGLIWSKYLGASIDASPAIAENGDIFIATTGSMLWALSASGNVKWSHSIATGQDYDITSSAAMAGDGSAVYIGTQDWTGGYLDAFNPTNGALLWQTSLQAEVNSSPAVSASDGTIYVTTTGGISNGLFSINPTTHATNWLFQTDAPGDSESGLDSSPAVGPDCTIYFLANNDLFAVNPNGTLAWFFPLPCSAAPTASPAIDAAGNILIGSSDGYVYCVSPSGALQWLFDIGTGSTINSSIAIGPGGLVVAATQNGILFALTNGVPAWQWTNSSRARFVSSPAISQDYEVVIGSEDYAVYCITNGRVKWSYATGSYILSSPAISPLTGAVVIGSEDDYLYSLAGVGSLATNAPWPMFHANPRHSGATPNPACSGGAAPVAFPNNPFMASDYSQFGFDISGTPGSGWEIYASSNLTTWETSGSVVVDPGLGYGSFTDYSVAGITNRFYQARTGDACSQVIGFINLTIPSKTNLIANQFYQVNDPGSYNDYPQNTASGWLGFLENNYLALPDQSQIMNWNGRGFNVDTYDLGQLRWQPTGDDTLLPGQAEFFVTTNYPITVTFAGLIAPGVSTNVISPGTNFVSSIVPWAGPIHSNLGYNPNNGDQVLLWTGSGYSTHTYSTNTGLWSGGEPSLNVGEGFLLVASKANTWVESFSACQSGLFVVPANPVWTDTGIHVNSNDVVYFPAAGTWNGGTGLCGPSGLAGGSADPFLATAVDDSLIAFVGPNPYYWGTNYEWGNSSYFPQGASTNGYWPLGASNQFTTDRAGELWFGFNDDAVQMKISDNYGSVAGYIQITGP